MFSWNFVDLYGLNTDQLVVWNTFLQGGSDVSKLTEDLQAITDKTANDDSIKKVEVSWDEGTPDPSRSQAQGARDRRRRPPTPRSGNRPG